MKNQILSLLLVLSLITSCQETTSENKINETKDRLNSTIVELNECKENNKKFINLSKFENLRSQEVIDDDLFFNIDLGFPGHQIIHLSSDPTMFPFILICEINSSPSRNGRTIGNMSIAIRSTELLNPNPYFKIEGVPILEKIDGGENDYLLKASIDLNDSPTSSRTMTPSYFRNILEIRYGQTIEVEIDSTYLLNSLIELNKTNPFLTEDQVRNFNRLCCAGVICQGRFVFN